VKCQKYQNNRGNGTKQVELFVYDSAATTTTQKHNEAVFSIVPRGYGTKQL
jgi:hypothetical protein